MPHTWTTVEGRPGAPTLPPVVLYYLIAVGLTILITSLIKYVVCRPRPCFLQGCMYDFEGSKAARGGTEASETTLGEWRFCRAQDHKETLATR